jgi:hypothetical protein
LSAESYRFVRALGEITTGISWSVYKGLKITAIEKFEVLLL